MANVEMNIQTRQVRVSNRSIYLSTKEFTLAELFLRYPGQVLSRERLLSYVWGYDYSPGSNIIDVYVGYLRKKLGKDLIKTVRGIGHCLKFRGDWAAIVRT
ncbi:MAG: winged helix-turn-helix domain-containing protein [Cyanobacteria bacterium J06628_4]